MATTFYVCMLLTGVAYSGAVPHFLMKDGQQSGAKVDRPTSDIEKMTQLLTGARIFSQRLLVKYYFKKGGERRARNDFAAVKPRDVNDFTDGSSYGFIGGRGIHFVPADIRARRLAAITITGRNTLMPRKVIYYYENAFIDKLDAFPETP